MMDVYREHADAMTAEQRALFFSELLVSHREMLTKAGSQMRDAFSVLYANEQKSSR